MWLSSQSFHRYKAIIASGAFALALSGCGFTPLYGTNGVTSETPLVYAIPATQADQIIYNELALSFPRSTNPDAPVLTISSSGSSRRVGRSSTGLPTTTHEWTHTATATITQADPLNPDLVETIYQGSKSVGATYTTNGQRLADEEAVKEAQNRAAKAVAQSLRLSIKAALGNR